MLVVAALLCSLGACSSDDDNADSNQAADTTDQSTAQSTAADDTVANGDAEAIADLEAQLATTQSSLEESQATVAEQQAMITDLTAENDALTATNTDLTAQLAAETTRADEAQAQLDDIAAMFPVTVGASLAGYDLVGPYTLSMTEAYCDGLPTCGSTRPDVHADIIQGPNGLQLQVPTVLTTGLFAVNGSLFAVTDSNLILPPCAGAQRNARVSITIFADGITIASDGSRTLSGLGASLLVSADPQGSCGAGVVFFAAKLTPV